MFQPSILLQISPLSLRWLYSTSLRVHLAFSWCLLQVYGRQEVVNGRKSLVEGLTVIVCPVEVGSRRVAGSSSIQPSDPSPLKVAK